MYTGSITNTDMFQHTATFDAHSVAMGTAIKRPVPDPVKPSFVIFDIQAL